MSNRDKLREYRRKQEAAKAVAAMSEPRAIQDDVLIPGAGPRRLQLVYVPSFEPGTAWEIRDGFGSLHLYGSEVTWVGGRLLRHGYAQVGVSGNQLQEYLDAVWALRLPIGPLRGNVAGLDGETWQLALFGGLYSQVRFEWWTDPPKQWQRLAALVARMRNAFLQLPSKA